MTVHPSNFASQMLRNISCALHQPFSFCGQVDGSLWRSCGPETELPSGAGQRHLPVGMHGFPKLRGGDLYNMADGMFMTSACLGWENLAVVNLSGGWYVGSSTDFQQGQLDILCELPLTCPVRLWKGEPSPNSVALRHDRSR